MDALLQDVRFALRTLARRPLVAGGALISLAIGIAANTAVFGIVNGVLLRPVPGVTRPERLVEISRAGGGAPSDVTYSIYRQLSDQKAVLDGLAPFSQEVVSISGGGEPSVRGALVVTDDYFSLLGVHAAQGRVFATDEARFPSVAPVAVISHDVWQREFAGAADILGREMRVNGVPLRVIGVLPRGFAGHHTGLLTDVFLPLGLSAPGLPAPASLAGAGSSLQLLGRLRDGVSNTEAARALSAAAHAVGRVTGESTDELPYVVAVASWGPLPAEVRGPVAAFLSVLGALVGLALTMACINVSTILLAQASERQRELAVRRAMGASEGRLVRQLVTEVGVLFVGAGALGVAATVWATRLATGVGAPVPLPGRLGADIGVDLRVLAFASVLTLAAALAFSLLPAVQASRFALVPALREVGATDTRGRARLRGGLVGVQVAVTSVLLAATLVFGRALLHLRSLDPGWNGDGVVVAPIDLQLNGTPRAEGQIEQREMLDRLSALPEVEVASLAAKLPLGGRSSFGLASVPGAALPDGRPGLEAFLNRVSPGYLRTMRIPLLRGRDVARTDDDGADNVAVINATMAARLWPDADPLGRTFATDLRDLHTEFRVIGIAADAELRVPGQAPENFYYVSAAQWYNSNVILHVRARPGLEAAIAPAVQQTIQAVDPSLPLVTPQPITEALEIFLLPQRLAAWVSGAMAFFGLLLALVGVYGLTAFLVSRRSREMAIRIALGATNGQVLRLLLLRGGRAPLIGLGAGVLLSSVLTYGAGLVVPGARVGDPVVIAGVPLVLALTAALAMLAPVRRVLGKPPMSRLREE